MKKIAIFGASRAGKTTLARMINQKYPQYHLISGDSIRSAFQNVFPQNGIDKFGGHGMKDDYAKFCAYLFRNQAKRDKGYFNYIFDSCDVSVEKAVEYFQDDDTVMVFLGYARLTPEEALANYRKYEREEDWTRKRTDEQLLEHARNWIENSKRFAEDCKKYGVKYVDTSYEREKVLAEVFEEVKEKISES